MAIKAFDRSKPYEFVRRAHARHRVKWRDARLPPGQFAPRASSAAKQRNFTLVSADRASVHYFTPSELVSFCQPVDIERQARRWDGKSGAVPTMWGGKIFRGL